jgi:hypothetical protein
MATVALGLFVNWASEDGPNRWVWVIVALATACFAGLLATPRLAAQILGRRAVDINIAKPRHLHVQQVGACWALPDPLTRADAERATKAARSKRSPRDGYRAIDRCLYDLGGAEVNVTERRITFQGAELPAVVTAMRAEIRERTSVLTGTFVTVGLGGGEEPLRVELDLDSDHPASPWFDQHVITLSPGESVVVHVTATAVASSVTWDLLIDFVVAGRTRTERLRSEDFLLRTTGLPCHTDTHECYDSDCITHENYQVHAYIGRQALVIN